MEVEASNEEALQALRRLQIADGPRIPVEEEPNRAQPLPNPFQLQQIPAQVRVTQPQLSQPPPQLRPRQPQQ